MPRTRTFHAVIVLLCATLAACGGSSGGGAQQPPPAPPAPAPPAPPPPEPPAPEPPAPEPPAPPPPAPPPINQADAFRFLNQATFGATEEAAAEVIALGYDAWIDAQLDLPASRELPHLQALPVPQALPELQRDRIDIWFRNALDGSDQLRQRTAFALSEIMVVSQVGALDEAPYSLASYYDLLATHAFGNFRDLIEAVTLHPAMGVYLSMLGNQKPDEDRRIRPDENYARELMQLFTIGLVELELDGSVKLDANGRPLSTYDQAVIEGFAHVYTGWTYAGATSFLLAQRTIENQVQPMQLYPEFHATGEKRLLGGVTIPAGLTGEQDLEAALDNIFAHPNTGPFIAQRLIQRLVTSNPSPAYIARVAARFNDDGSGVRGDLGAVVEAILLDEEARGPTTDSSGKLKEPLLRLTQLWRAYDARAATGSYAFSTPNVLLGQGPLQSPSVFNFFSPFYAPPGEIRDRGLAAPELEIATEFQNTVLTNVMAVQAFQRNSRSPGLKPEDIVIDIEGEVAVADDADALVAMVDRKLLAGEMSQTLRTEVTRLVSRIPGTDEASRAQRAAEAIYFVVTSPEFALQR